MCLPEGSSTWAEKLAKWRHSVLKDSVEGYLYG